MRTVFVILSIPGVLLAQNNLPVLQLNQDFEPCRADSARYYRVGTMVDGYLQGDCKEYYASGKLFSTSFYNQHFEPEGFVLIYHENGKRKERGHFVKDVYKVQRLWDSEGNPLLKRGKGKVKEMYENGSLKYEGEFRHGLRDGEWIFYYRNGLVSEKGNYKFGIYFLENAWDAKGNLQVSNGTGHLLRYYANGQLKCKVSYRSGLLHGKCTWYFPNGNIQKVGVFEEGLEVGVHTEYYNTGKFKSKSGFQMGMLHGVYLCYYPNGRIRYSCEFRNGDICSELTHFDEKGNRVPTYDSEDGPHWQSFNTRIVKNKWW
ncbi:MAG: toxin-antitoxin system YwqK family antitoxin [Cytophagaceae bacterium]|jgi:antitoxin component YwqK of YwqJK toxin-antitoxin module|nr:toxin-antitoxin system YwqK family antitoxin [Cytophagaceae bacterium]